MKEGKNEKGKRGWPAGPRRRRPELAGVGRRWAAKAPREKVVDGASVVQMKKMKFGNGVSENEARPRWKEYDEEKKMVCLLVIKVV